MTIFKSRTAESLNCDPEPWWYAYNGQRASGTESASLDARNGYNPAKMPQLDPRPEFTPTRDPGPWVEHEAERRLSQKEVDAGNERSRCWRGLEWSPRPEFDTPVNPILVKYRESDERTQWHMRAGSWISWPTPPYPDGAADHARRVFARLAALMKED